jgi:hypothetical protein
MHDFSVRVARLGRDAPLERSRADHRECTLIADGVWLPAAIADFQLVVVLVAAPVPRRAPYATIRARARLHRRANTDLTYRHRASRLILGAGIIGSAGSTVTPY